jgi:hypothetical protein
MKSGHKNQTVKQIGEYLVAAELARRGLMVATFSGNVPDFDLIATDLKGSSLPIQVKTIRGGSWQFSIDQFIEVAFKGKKQVLGRKRPPRIPHLICVLVVATEYGKDRFFVLEWEQLRKVVVSDYRKCLKSHGGIRPRKPESLHCAADPRQLVRFADIWSSITDRF